MQLATSSSCMRVVLDLGRGDLADRRDLEAQLQLAADVRVALEAGFVARLDGAEAAADLACAMTLGSSEPSTSVGAESLTIALDRALAAALAGADLAGARRAQRAAAAQACRCRPRPWPSAIRPRRAPATPTPPTCANTLSASPDTSPPLTRSATEPFSPLAPRILSTPIFCTSAASRARRSAAARASASGSRGFGGAFGLRVALVLLGLFLLSRPSSRRSARRRASAPRPSSARSSARSDRGSPRCPACAASRCCAGR